MSDLDFITDLRNGDFKVSLTDNPQSVSGNRVLLNRFEITFLTKIKMYFLGDSGAPVIDRYGGNGEDLITSPQVINDPQGIMAKLTIAIEKTVDSMKSDEPNTIPDSEKISGAELINMYIQNGIVFAKIKVDPVEIQSYNYLISDLPVTKR